MMAYYCWTLRRDESQAAHRRSSKRSFEGKKTLLQGSVMTKPVQDIIYDFIDK